MATLRDIEQGRTVTPRPASVTRLAEALQLSGRQRSELAALAAAPAISRPPGPPKADDNGKPRVRVEVLGPVGASRNGAPVPLGPVRQRAVLALLALHADTGLSRAAIIDALWHDDPPAAAVVMVQGYITQIRGLLGSVGGVETDDHRIDLPPIDPTRRVDLIHEEVDCLGLFPIFSIRLDLELPLNAAKRNYWENHID